VVSIDTLCHDLTNWDTLYLSGRLQKPVKILRDDPKVRLANHINLLSAVRVALLLLPQTFTEHQLYTTIAGISYMGDPRMSFAENPHKVQNIVNNQVANFRRLYSPLIEQLPNVSFVSGNISWNDAATKTMLVQDMDPVRRGNMVRRLPRSFRDRLYFQYQRKYAIPELEFQKMVKVSDDEERMRKREGGEFERRIASDTMNIGHEVGTVIKSTVAWPSTVQSLKGLATAGPINGIRYLGEKVEKWKLSRKASP
jgi:translocator assembly and maintenance protein 41